MTTKLTPEALYLQLGQLVSEMPDLTLPPTPETNRWLGRAVALVEASGDRVGAGMLAIYGKALWGNEIGRAMNAQSIAVTLHAALAKAELDAPAASQGSFIPAGGAFDAFAAVAKVLSAAKREIVVIDPYADEKFLTDFAPTASEQVPLRLLTDEATYKPSLKPAAERWQKQYGSTRPLEARLAPARTLHDRLIMVDGATAWTVGQSFKDLAERAHSSINRVDQETAKLKIAAYADLWKAAKVLQ